jgi:hypothetical protein
MASRADFANRFSTLVIRFCDGLSRYYINKHPRYEEGPVALCVW